MLPDRTASLRSRRDAFFCAIDEAGHDGHSIDQKFRQNRSIFLSRSRSAVEIRTVDLTATQRNLISRATALCVGLAFCYFSYKCLIWTHRLLNDPVAQAMRADRTHRQERTGAPITMPVTLAALSGVVGLAVVGFAVLPTRVMHMVSPMYNQTDPDNLAGG
jgi:hypothetical protein